MSYAGVFECLRGFSNTTSDHAGIAFTSAIPVGDYVWIFANVPSATAASGFTATDTKGNTWTQRIYTPHTTPSNCSLVCMTAKIAAGKAITTSDTFTLTCTDKNPTYWSVIGAASADPTAFDTTAIISGITTASKTPASGNTAANGAQAAQLVVGAVAVANDLTNTFTMGAGYTQLGAGEAATAKSLYVGYGYFNVTAKRSIAGGLKTSTAAVSGLVAANVAAPAAPASYNAYRKNSSGVWVPLTQVRL